MQLDLTRHAGTWVILTVIVLSLFFSAEKAMAQPRYSLDLGVDFSSGDYGTDITTDSLALSLALGYYPTERLDLRLTIPWLYQTGGIITTAGGIRLGGPSRQAGEEGTGGQPGRPFAAAIGDEGQSSQSGLGDLTLAAGYVLLQETDVRPMLRPNAFVKFPTAEENMGTGEYDLGVGLDLSKWLAKWYLFGRGSAIFQGGKADLGLKDFATYEGGVGHPLSDRLLPVLSLWGASSPAESSSSLLEARLSLSYRLSDSKGLSFTGTKGLSSSSPDYGLAGNLFFNF
jgi:hypothetical protein